MALVDRKAFQDTFGPWALVCGASEGLGAALARELAKRGLNLILIARRIEPLAQLTSSLRTKYAIEVQYHSIDLSQETAVSGLMEFTQGLDVGLLVYNAAYIPVEPYLNLAWPEHQKVLAVNCQTLAGTVWQMGQRLKARGRGGALIIGSMAGFQGTPLLAHYAATKAYGLTLVEGLYPEWKRLGLHIHCAVAGATLTPGYYASKPNKIWPPAPEQSPEAVAQEAVENLSNYATRVTGKLNRFAPAFMRLLPRSIARTLMANTTRRLYARL